MDDLREIILTFDAEDKKEFRHFLNRIRQRSKRMDRALFDILCEDDEYRSKVVMNRLYNLPIYAAHLERRKQKQTIMLGFSDGTKDGGYLKANHEIFKTKETLSRVSEENQIQVIFFDGRGGPPATQEDQRPAAGSARRP